MLRGEFAAPPFSPALGSDCIPLVHPPRPPTAPLSSKRNNWAEQYWLRPLFARASPFRSAFSLGPMAGFASLLPFRKRTIRYARIMGGSPPDEAPIGVRAVPDTLKSIGSFSKDATVRLTN
jgi:hypothetical protein